ncbi:hypothetical protein LCGC14_2544610, partial [marine sediment metagenome]
QFDDFFLIRKVKDGIIVEPKFPLTTEVNILERKVKKNK